MTEETETQPTPAPTTPAKPKRVRNRAAKPTPVQKVEAAAVQVKKPRKKRGPNKAKTMPGVTVSALAPAYQERMEGVSRVTGFRVTCELKEIHFKWLERVAAMEGRSMENMLDRLVRLHYAADPYKGQQPDTSGRSFSGRAADLGK